jgi:hypothetical protein
MSSQTQSDAPDYDVKIDADELLTRLVVDSANYGEQYEEKRQWWSESLDHCDEWHEARYWMQEARGGQRAYSEAIAALQPEAHALLVDCYRNNDGTVDVRGYMAWLSKRATEAHERSGSVPGRNPQADEAESAYTSILSTIRDGYGVGWPRLDDVGGNPLECDLP